MQPARNPVDVVRDLTRDLTHDLAPRTARASGRSVRRRVGRLRERWFLILQCAVSAGIAWFLATVVLDHPEPFLAPVAAIICLGMSFGQRFRRVVEVSVGVGVGVLVGTGFAHIFGSGPWQITVVALLAMTVAVLLGASVLIVSQAGAQSVIVIALVTHNASGLDRWFDALVGAAVAVVVTAVLPLGPVRKPRILAGRMLDLLASLLYDAATGLRDRDLAKAQATLERARSTEDDLSAFEVAAGESLAWTRHSLLGRPSRDRAAGTAQLVAPIDLAVRNCRVLTRQARTAVRYGEPPPAAVVDLVEELGFQVGRLAAVVQLDRDTADLRASLLELGRRARHADPGPALSGAVILAQVRSMVVDLVRLTGVDEDTAARLFRTPEEVEDAEDAEEQGGA